MKRLITLFFTFLLTVNLASPILAQDAEDTDDLDCTLEENQDQDECMEDDMDDSDDDSEDDDSDEDESDEDDDMIFECPDPEQEIDWDAGRRGQFLARLMENNPEAYEALVTRLENLMRHRWMRLNAICERNPERFQRLMERRQEVLERLEEKRDRVEVRFEEKREDLRERLRMRFEGRFDTEKMEICHQSEFGGEVTLKISERAWEAHESHGDFEGECEDDVLDTDEDDRDEMDECDDDNNDEECEENDLDEDEDECDADDMDECEDESNEDECDDSDDDDDCEEGTES